MEPLFGSELVCQVALNPVSQSKGDVGPSDE